MTQRAAHAPQDFQKMCKQAERDHESKKLVVLIERVKRKLQEHGTGPVTTPKPPVGVLISGGMRTPATSRSTIFER
jgi:hypothetical protein